MHETLEGHLDRCEAAAAESERQLQHVHKLKNDI